MRSSITSRMLWVPLLVIALLGACSSSDGPGLRAAAAPVDRTDTTVPAVAAEEAGATGPSGEASPSTGRILISSTPISGHEGHLLLVFGPNNESEICAAIDSDPWMLEETALTDRPADSDPCTGSGNDSYFGPGDHAVTASIFVPGSRTALNSTAAVVEPADGDRLLELDGSKLSGSTAGEPGRIEVTVSEITGRAGKILIVMGQSNAASLCALIDADPWAMPAPAVLRELPGGDGGPCGEDTPVVLFPAGDTRVTAAVVTPGSPEAEATVEAIVAVDGDVGLAIDGGALSG